MDDRCAVGLWGPPAARSVLLTLLGEFVLPTPKGVWQETLINALGALDYKTQAARQALARSVTAGWLRTERHGRRSRVYLTPDTATMLSAGAERIYGFGEPWEWKGHWLLVVLRVPEERREIRHQVRTRLAWEGFGSIGGGLWISPHVEREEGLRDMAGDESVAELLTFHAETGRDRRARAGDRGRVGPRRRRPGLPRVHLRSSAVCDPRRPRRRSAPRPRSCTPGASSPSWIRTCRRTMLPAAWPRVARA